MYDAVIIGAGIIGTMLARDLSRYSIKVAVIDKENDVANGTTMANSAIVHTGYDPEEGTLKAKLNVRGAQLYPSICEQLHCHRKEVGAYVVACGKEEEEHLKVLAHRADERKVPYRWLSGEEARIKDPNLTDAVTRALDFYTTSVIYPWEVARACMENAVMNGTELYLNHEVTEIEKKEDTFIVYAGSDTFETRMVINCAGLGCEKIHDMVSDERDYTITPKRGEYFVLDNDIHFTDHIIFPVPGPSGKGVLAVPTVYGNTLIGPNAMPLEKDADVSTSAEGLSAVRKNISKTMKNVPFDKVIRTFAGLRASSNRHDFIIEEVKGVPGFIDVAGIESPGLASAPAISEYIIKQFIAEKLELTENKSAVMTIEKPVIMSELSEEERDEKIKENPLYARIICRCENISEQEIIDCIHRPAGATSIKGVKKRVRPGMGRCQGGFCEPRVLAILARELGVSVMDVVLDGPKSRILKRYNR